MIYAICNPAAGSGRGKKIGLQVEEALKKKGKTFTLVMTEGPGHATQLAAQIPDGETVLSIGGDGTSLEVARGLLGTRKTLGIIPAGTGNDFIKTLNIPSDPMEALEYVLSHPALETDVGELNGGMFLNEAGAGFDVAVLDDAQRAKKYCRGLLPYLYGVIRAVFRFRPISIAYQVDDGGWITKDVFVIGAANGGVIGGGIVIAPEAAADDGLLDVVIVGDIKRSRLPLRLIGLLRGRILDFPETTYLKARSVLFSAPQMRVNVDGEIVDMPEASIRILPKALLIHR